LPLGARGLLGVQRLRTFIQDVHREIAARHFDIVHSTLPVPGANVYQLRSGTMPAQRDASLRRRGAIMKPGVALARALNLYRHYRSWMERQVVVGSNTLCLAVSHMVARELRHYYGRRDGIRTIYNAVDSPDRASARRAEWRAKRRGELRLSKNDCLFMTVATNFELKGVAETLQAFSQWRRQTSSHGARLVVIGRNAPRAYEHLARRLGVASHVSFVPPTQEVYQWYAAADACILLSWYDPCSRVVLEATRWGIPSLTTTYNGAAEALGNGAGIVVSSPHSLGEVMAAMEELSEPRDRAQRSQACLKVAEALHMDRHVERLLDSYVELLRNPGGTHPNRLRVVPDDAFPYAEALPSVKETMDADKAAPDWGRKAA
jgi:UDP-glucose:(heptosyl)LPS alpha-1,3-glucosyltransferase